MVGDEEHSRVDVGGMTVQSIDQRGQHVVGVQQRVVVGVDDLLSRTGGEVVVAAGRYEALEGGRVALEVRRSVVAQHVQHQQLVAVRAAQRAQPVVQAAQQALVPAAAALAKAGCVGGTQRLV